MEAFKPIARDDELSGQLLRDGRALLQQYQGSQRWIKRWVEKIKFDDHRTIDITTTYDIEISDDDLEFFPTLGGWTLLPVKQIDRSIDLDLTIFDPSGASLPRPTRRHERRLVTAGLLASLYREEPSQPSAEKPTDPVQFYANLLEFMSRSPHERGYSVTLKGDPLWSLLEAEFRGKRTELEIVKEFRTFRLVLAAVETKFVADRHLFRLGVKYSHHLPSASEPVKSKGIDGVSLVFPVREIERAESFHFILLAPDEVYFDNTCLTVEVWEPGEACGKRHFYPETDPHFNRVHIYCQVPSTWSQEGLIVEANVGVRMWPMTMGAMRRSIFASSLCATFLLILLFTIGWQHSGLPALFKRPLSEQTESLVTVLLVGPTLLVGIFLNVGGHLMTQEVLKGVQWRLGVAGLSTLLASLLLALGTDGLLLSVSLLALTLLSLLILINTAISYISFSRGLRKLRPPISQQYVELLPRSNVTSGQHK